MKTSYSHSNRAVTTYNQRRNPERMFTEGGLINEAKNFLAGKNLFDGNLLENKQFAYTSMMYRKENEISQEREFINNQIDDELDEPNEYVTSMQNTRVISTKSRRFRSTGFEGYDDKNFRTQTAGLHQWDQRRLK